MGGVAARHDEIVGEVVAGYGGHVFKKAGAAFAVAFARSVDAASAAGEAQRRLAAEPWPELAPIRVRMGLHPGEAQERDGGLLRAGCESRPGV
jgi:class 3 adenylate cyclase